MELAGGLSFLHRPLPPRFELLVITLAPGRDRPFAASEWRDAVAIVERGAIELEDTDQECLRLRCGAVLSLSGLHVRALRNPGTEPAVVTVVRRRGT
jgi:hypothetical protein